MTVKEGRRGGDDACVKCERKLEACRRCLIKRGRMMVMYGE